MPESKKYLVRRQHDPGPYLRYGQQMVTGERQLLWEQATGLEEGDTYGGHSWKCCAVRYAEYHRPGLERADRLVRFLSSCDWDVLALQEVSHRTQGVITASGIAESSLYTMDGFKITPQGKLPHGVALLARNGFRLAEPQLILGLPKAERALSATTTVRDITVTVAS